MATITITGSADGLPVGTASFTPDKGTPTVRPFKAVKIGTDEFDLLRPDGTIWYHAAKFKSGSLVAELFVLDRPGVKLPASLPCTQGAGSSR